MVGMESAESLTESGVPLRAVRDKVVICEAREVEVTKGGLLIPTTYAQKPWRGTVVAVGPDVYDVSPGDDVVFMKFVGHDVKVGDRTFRVMSQEAIYCVLEGAEGVVEVEQEWVPTKVESKP